MIAFSSRNKCFVREDIFTLGLGVYMTNSQT
jgi:hypothetical protein